MDWKANFEKVKEQEWYQQLQNGYQQLTPEQQTYAKWGAVGAALVVILFSIFSVMDMSNTAKKEFYQKEELARILTQANDELRRLKGQNSGITQGAAQTWAAVFQGLAGIQGLPQTSVEILKESPGASQNLIQETLLEVKVVGAPLRALVQMLYMIDHGSPPMKLKGLMIEPSAGDGPLNAKLNISGYMPKAEKGEKGK